MRQTERDLFEQLRIETGSMFISDMDFGRRDFGRNAAALAAMKDMELEQYPLQQLNEAARYLRGVKTDFKDYAEADSFFK